MSWLVSYRVVILTRNISYFNPGVFTGWAKLRVGCFHCRDWAKLGDNKWIQVLFISCVVYWVGIWYHYMKLRGCVDGTNHELYLPLPYSFCRLGFPRFCSSTNLADTQSIHHHKDRQDEGYRSLVFTGIRRGGTLYVKSQSLSSSMPT